MNKSFKKGISLLLLTMALPVAAQQRQETLLKQWTFSRDSVEWKNVTVPHDWAISGPFDRKWDLQRMAIVQDGQEKPIEHTGRSGGLPWIGKGFYRTSFNLSDTHRQAELYFDGAMAEPQVYVNGRLAGSWHFGYNAFRIDITPYIKKGENQVFVKLHNMEESSRWYPGAGLYRPVKLILTAPQRIDPWETFFRTIKANADQAQVSIDTKVAGFTKNKKLNVKFFLEDMKGRLIAQKAAHPDGSGAATTQFIVPRPQLWSPETPHLYVLKTCLYQGKKLIDRTQQRVGIRTVEVSRNGGFKLNGVSRKIQGVCLHHDLGPLGAAVNKAAIIRQIRTMKAMGADAIRTSHNMPSQMQMDVCDSMGIMVMAESFDEWKDAKMKNGYHKYYDDWWRKDIANLIKGHRNHPSIIMWSIGNEIPEQWKEEGAARAKAMTDFCHRLDPTRTVTCGVDNPEGAVKCGFFSAVDVPGFNYRDFLYDKLFPNLKQGFLLGSETTSTVSTRGVYHFPVEEGKMVTHEDGQCSSYDLECCGWSNLPDEDFHYQDDRAWTIGQFVWTGQDYLGEPTPYYAGWPSRSSYFGIVDLAGLPKDRYYMYRSVWNKRVHTLHLLPHWTWPGREGKVTPVYCYTDYPKAELFVNGISQGMVQKNDTARLDRYRLRWPNVVYQPGELKVVAYNADGTKAAEQTVRTASEPVALHLKADRNTIKADGDDLSYITVSMEDKNGTPCPTTDDQLEFEVSGAGSFKAACNGNPRSLEPFTTPRMRLFSGQLVVVVQAANHPGTITLKVKAPEKGLEKTINITTN